MLFIKSAREETLVNVERIGKIYLDEIVTRSSGTQQNREWALKADWGTAWVTEIYRSNDRDEAVSAFQKLCREIGNGADGIIDMGEMPAGGYYERI